ncbi:hypothetical protein PflA506_1467 [Pseudomonas fluorescens A506]|nr:hypothetical protein PflA506_1467 [Pseudomonas fluorescens A506]
MAWYNSLIKQTLLIVKISKNQIIQLSVVSILIGMLSFNSLFGGATERIVAILNYLFATLKFAFHGFDEFLNLFIYPASIFCILGLIVVYAPMLFLSFRNGRQS